MDGFSTLWVVLLALCVGGIVYSICTISFGRTDRVYRKLRCELRLSCLRFLVLVSICGWAAMMQLVPVFLFLFNKADFFKRAGVALGSCIFS